MSSINDWPLSSRWQSVLGHANEEKTDDRRVRPGRGDLWASGRMDAAVGTGPPMPTSVRGGARSSEGLAASVVSGRDRFRWRLRPADCPRCVVVRLPGILKGTDASRACPSIPVRPQLSGSRPAAGRHHGPIRCNQVSLAGSRAHVSSAEEWHHAPGEPSGGLGGERVTLGGRER